MTGRDDWKDRDEPLSGGWLDIVALIIATYQILAVPFLLLLLFVGLGLGIFFFVFR